MNNPLQELIDKLKAQEEEYLKKEDELRGSRRNEPNELADYNHAEYMGAFIARQTMLDFFAEHDVIVPKQALKNKDLSDDIADTMLDAMREVWSSDAETNNDFYREARPRCKSAANKILKMIAECDRRNKKETL
jgi:hypothetical protein